MRVDTTGLDIRSISLLPQEKATEGYLLLHGITGTPLEMTGLASHLHDHHTQIEIPLLAGHGGTLEDLRKVPIAIWVNNAETSLHAIYSAVGGPVHLVGLSFGALLALELAARNPNLVASVVALSPPLKLRSRFWDHLLSLVSRLPEFALAWISWARPKSQRPPNVLAMPHYALPAYPFATASRVMKLRRSVLKRLRAIRCQVLVCLDPNDHLVDPHGLRNMPSNLLPLSLTIQEFPGAQHEMTLGHSHQQVFEAVKSFCRALKRST